MAGLVLMVVGALAVGALGQRVWERCGSELRAATPKMQLKMPTLPKALDQLPLVPKGPSRIVYLNREGAVLQAGHDDASHNASSIVASANLAAASVPAFVGSSRRWNDIVKCVSKQFEPYDVKVVDQRPRPEEGSYIMAMLGGRPTLLGADIPVKSKLVTGLAPFSGEPIRDAVVLIFARQMKESLRSVCETASMEIAHAYGLDHARSCKDVMTYMRPCGAKSFTDKSIACGEDKDRTCKGGAATQNSHERLLALLGPRPVEPVGAGAASAKTASHAKRNISGAEIPVGDDGHIGHTH